MGTQASLDKLLCASHGILFLTFRPPRLFGVFGFAVAGLSLLIPATTALAQATGPNPNAPPAKAERIETEVVTVMRATALPATITRKPGPFFLFLKTEIRDPEWNLSLVPDAALSDTSKLANALDLPGLRKKTRSAGLVDLVPGTYQLQVLPEGKTICTITIAEGPRNH